MGAFTPPSLNDSHIRDGRAMNIIDLSSRRLRHEPKIRLLQVVRADQLSARMRRVALGGPALDGFASPAADDHVKLFFPAAGRDEPMLPVIGADGPGFPDGAARPIARDYTPRYFGSRSRELAIDFVLHGDGPAATWAAQASPGQRLGVGGLRGSLLVSDAFDAYLLAGDEAALPAIGRWLEELRPGARAIAFIEVADAGEERRLPTTANASVAWLHRNGRSAGAQTLLLDALRSTVLPPGHVHAWLAGEIDVVRALRAHLLNERNLPREHVRAAGYWRIGQAEAHTRLED